MLGVSVVIVLGFDFGLSCSLSPQHGVVKALSYKPGSIPDQVIIFSFNLPNPSSRNSSWG
jgi:hypothetical protein